LRRKRRPALGERAGAQLAAAGAVFAIAAIVAVVVLARDDVRLSGTNSVRPDAFVVTLRPGDEAVCQTNLLVPKGTAGVRVLAGSYGRPGPRLTATLKDSAGKVLGQGSAAGYPDATRPVLRFPRLDRTTAGDEVCFRSTGRVALAGQNDPNADNASELIRGGRALPADVSVQLVKEARQSLLALAPTVFHRAALFRPGWVGPWTFYVLGAFAILLAIAAVPVLVLLGGRVVPAILAVATFAFLNAAVWSLVMPSFQPPDEASHYAYVESLVERHHRPALRPEEGGGSYTLGSALAIETTAVGVVQNEFGRPPWTEREYRDWKRADAALGPHADEGGGGYTNAAAYSPLYYGLEAVPYVAGSGGDVFTRLWLMRLLSALMAAGTAALAFLFARELAPTVPWAGPLAGLTAAFQPMLVFIGGAVNNDNLLILVAAAELYLLARALRRGLDVRLALAIGAVLGIGITAKPGMVALVPVAVLAVGWVLWRGERRPVSRAAVAAAALGAFALAMALRYALFPQGEELSNTLNAGNERSFGLGDFLSYLWQWYLPPLPSMTNRFVGLPVYYVYFKGFWGTFGHLDTKFDGWVYALLAVAGAATAALAALTVWRARARLTGVAPRVLLCVLAVVGFALLINLRSYLALINGDAQFAQGRYLLPAVPVLGAALVAAALAFGRRRGAVAAAVAVAGIAALNLFSLGLVLSRYYT
jgi:hypothetical protein